MNDDQAKTALLTVSVVSLTFTAVALYNLKQRQSTKEKIQEKSKLVPSSSQSYSNVRTRRFDSSKMSQLRTESVSEPDTEPDSEAKSEMSGHDDGPPASPHRESVDYRELYEARLDRVSFLEEELRQAQLKLFNAENLSWSYQTRITALQNENESYVRFMEAEIEGMKTRFEEERLRSRQEISRLQEELEEEQLAKEVKTSVAPTEGSCEGSEEVTRVHDEPNLEALLRLQEIAEKHSNTESPQQQAPVAPPPISLTTPAMFPALQEAVEEEVQAEDEDQNEHPKVMELAIIASIMAFLAAW